MNALVPAMVLVAALQSGLQMETIARDNMSNAEDAKQAVARTPAEWAALWRLHAGDQAPPKIDFTKRTVVAVFLGTRPTAGYAVEVSGTKPVGKTLIVEWSEQTPTPGHVLAQVITSPSHLVSIPKFDGEITFRKVDR
jgi:hypothetical protein